MSKRGKITDKERLDFLFNDSSDSHKYVVFRSSSKEPYRIIIQNRSDIDAQIAIRRERRKREA